MRAPRWFRDFCAWRWAPFVALVAGALAFILLVLLLVPRQLDAALQPADASRPPSARETAPQSAVAETPAEGVVDVIAPRSADSEVARAPLPTAAPVSTPVPAANEAAAVTPPDYASNITARADRPARPALHSSP